MKKFGLNFENGDILVLSSFRFSRFWLLFGFYLVLKPTVWLVGDFGRYILDRMYISLILNIT